MGWGMKPGYSAVVVVAISLLMGACAKQAPVNPAAGAQPDPAHAAAPVEARYPLTGEIVKVDAERQMLLVSHDKIPGFMMAMTMEFKVTKADLANARVGQRIRAELVVAGADLRLEKIWPDDTVTKTTLDAAANALARIPQCAARRLTARSARRCRASPCSTRKAAPSRPAGFAAGGLCSISSSPAARSRRCARPPPCGCRSCKKP